VHFWLESNFAITPSYDVDMSSDHHSSLNSSQSPTEDHHHQEKSDRYTSYISKLYKVQKSDVPSVKNSIKSAVTWSSKMHRSITQFFKGVIMSLIKLERRDYQADSKTLCFFIWKM
jgi:hypothetical protein